MSLMVALNIQPFSTKSSSSHKKVLTQHHHHSWTSVRPAFGKKFLTPVHNLHIANFNPSGVIEHDSRLSPYDRAFGFGEFVAHEARINHEYWGAAWLRAECHWEGKETDRFVENYKRMYADQEFHAMKRRRNSPVGETCKSIVMTKKGDATTRYGIAKSIVGTLDLSINYSERAKLCLFGHNVIGSKPCEQYGYIANLCVAKSARRQGIASNMLRFAVLCAKEDGVGKVFVEVFRGNKEAQVLYRKLGFQVVDAATDQTYLLCLEPSKLEVQVS